MNKVMRKICLLGDGAVGKTSLIRRYVFDRFERVLKLLQLANDKMAVTDSIMLVSIAPGTIPDIDLNMLKRELEVIE